MYSLKLDKAKGQLRRSAWETGRGVPPTVNAMMDDPAPGSRPRVISIRRWWMQFRKPRLPNEDQSYFFPDPSEDEDAVNTISIKDT